MVFHIGTDLAPSYLAYRIREVGAHLDIDVELIQVTFARNLELVLCAKAGVLQQDFLDLGREDIDACLLYTSDAADE